MRGGLAIALVMVLAEPAWAANPRIQCYPEGSTAGVWQPVGSGRLSLQFRQDANGKAELAELEWTSGDYETASTTLDLTFAPTPERPITSIMAHVNKGLWSDDGSSPATVALYLGERQLGAWPSPGRPPEWATATGTGLELSAEALAAVQLATGLRIDVLASDGKVVTSMSIDLPTAADWAKYESTWRPEMESWLAEPVDCATDDDPGPPSARE